MRGKVQHNQNVRECFLLLDTFREVFRLDLDSHQAKIERQTIFSFFKESLTYGQKYLDWDSHNLHPYMGENISCFCA